VIGQPALKYICSGDDDVKRLLGRIQLRWRTSPTPGLFRFPVHFKHRWCLHFLPSLSLWCNNSSCHSN